jgi:hypothetical protein
LSISFDGVVLFPYVTRLEVRAEDGVNNVTAQFNVYFSAALLRRAWYLGEVKQIGEDEVVNVDPDR